MAGVRFRERMAGPFALGEADPRAGEAAGRRAGTRLEFVATITFDDVDAALADPGHTGRVTGQVDADGLGAGLAIEAGEFHLLVRAEGERRMVYRLRFSDPWGGVWLLSGHKSVPGGPIFSLWHDTTTLYARIHRGGSGEGPVAGAGVLYISLPDFLRTAAGMRPVHARDPLEGVAALERFGRFFFGELWDLYMRRQLPRRYRAGG